MKQLYIIDGNNLLHTMLSQKIITAESDFEQARHQLIGYLQEFAGKSGYDVTLVYDGTIGGDAPEYKLPGFTVLFSEENSSADTIIENIVSSSANKQNITVITSDHAEAHVVRAAGAFVISCRNFIESLLNKKQETHHYINNPANKIRPVTLGDIFPE